MNERLQKLYQEVILKHDREPVNYQKMEDPDLVFEAYNQFCGDQFNIYLKTSGREIEAASFHGYGCAISKASSSLLVKLLPGMTISEATLLYRNFMALVEEKSPENLPEELYAFEAVREFPGRTKCVTLSWEELFTQLS